jgi:glyoxylase-like metal-dependent hydrolase (beta-lactamase superfamily II)
MKAIDFSSKHHILIRNEEGSMRPMDEPYFESTLIAPGTWQILSDGDYSYLVEGDNEALVIDTGYGCGNIRDYCQTLTKKPVRKVANTHDHFDHTANNCYFECAYMSAETKKKATIPFPSFDGIDFPRNYPIKVIGEGYKFQLGNRELEVFEIPDHATGSLAFLDKRERVLFSGDEIGPMGKHLNGSVARFARHLQKLASRSSEFDRLCTGSGVIEAAWVEKYLANARYILAGHEGGAAQQFHPGPPAPVQANPPGVVIYDRRFPRPPDMPPNIGSITEHMRAMDYADCQIVYDVRNIND